MELFQVCVHYSAELSELLVPCDESNPWFSLRIVLGSNPFTLFFPYTGKFIRTNWVHNQSWGCYAFTSPFCFGSTVPTIFGHLLRLILGPSSEVSWAALSFLPLVTSSGAMHTSKCRFHPILCRGLARMTIHSPFYHGVIRCLTTHSWSLGLKLWGRAGLFSCKASMLL